MRFHHLLLCMLAAYLMSTGALTGAGIACAELGIPLGSGVANFLHKTCLVLFGVLFGHGFPIRS